MMRGFILLLLVCALTAGGFSVAPCALASPRVGEKKGRKSRPDADRAYALTDIMKNPKDYSEREVFFYARFATTSSLFKNINTRFNSNEHANFAVWPDKVVLWETKGRKDVLPTLYISKKDPDNLEQLRTLEKYELVAITGVVMNVYAGYPWIMVTKLERVETPKDRLCAPVVEHMQNGYDALSANSGGVAARHFEQALQFGLPPEYRAKAYEQLAQAYLLDNQLDKALSYLRQAVETDPSDAILNLALADVALRMEDPGEALAHCQFALERSGRLPQVYGIMGEARSLTGDYVKGFTDLNAAAGTPGISTREKAMVNVRRARIYTRAGRHPDAARVYAAATEAGEALAGEAWLHNEVGLFYEMLYLDTGDARYLDSAYMAYEEAARLNRLDAGYLYNMTEVEFRRQRLAPYPDFTLAKELITRINQVEPEYTPARILEGRVLFAEEKANEAEYRYQSVSGQIGNDAQALLALAEAYMDLGRYLDAGTAVRRARRLQPWNLRVQALGKHLEKLSEAAEQAKAEARRQAWPDDESTLGEVWQRDEFDRRTEAHEVWRPRPLPKWPQNDYREMQEEQCLDGRYGWAARNGFRQPAPARQRSRRVGPDYAPAAAPMDGRKVTVRPGEGIRVDSDGRARPEARPYPPEIQASASPAPAPGRPETPYPKTEVRLDNAAPARKSLRPESGFEPIAKPAPLDLGYNAAQEEVVEENRSALRITAGETEPRERSEERFDSRPVPQEPRGYERREEAGYDRRDDAPQDYGQGGDNDRRDYAPRDSRNYGEQVSDRRDSRDYGRRDDRDYAPRTRDPRDVRDVRDVRDYDRQEYDRRDPRDYDRRDYAPQARDPRDVRDVRAAGDYGRQEYDRRDSRAYDGRRDSRDYAPQSYDRRDSREYDSRDQRDYDSRDQRDYDQRDPRGYDRDYERNYGRDYEADRHDYGQIPGAGEAYASLSARDDGGYGDSASPVAFSFDPDASPVIIAGMTAPSASNREMPVRNANLYRKNAGDRRPAEIIERETVKPRRDGDHAAMVPPADGGLRRAEVRLPSSSQGVGMTSDYGWDR